MAVAFVFDFPGATQAQYEAALREVGLERGAAPQAGRLLHAAGPYDGGWCVVDIWESREALDAYFRDRLAAALERAGMPTPLLPQVFEIHNLER